MGQTTKDTILTDFLMGKNTVLPEMKLISKAAAELAMAQKQGLAGSNKAMSTFKEKAKGNVPAMKAMNAGLKETNNRFNMNILSWMFGGMALQRVSLMVTRFLIPSLEKLQKINSKGAKQIMAVTAAFEFLKISMFETLSNTNMFNSFVEFLVKAAVWASEFAQKNPKIIATAAALSLMGAALGTLAIGVGIFGQLEHLKKLIGITDAEGLRGMWKKFQGSLAQKIVGGLLVVWSVVNTFKDLKDGKLDFMDNFINAVTLGIGLKFLGMSKAGAFKFGVWAFVLTTLVEIALDPAGFGKFIIDLANMATRTIEKFYETWIWFENSIRSIVKGKGFAAIPSALSDWFSEFYTGQEEEVLKLFKEGKLSETLKIAWSDQIDEAISGSVPTTSISIPFEVFDTNLMGSNALLDNLKTSSDGFNSSVITGLGDANVSESVIGKYDSLNTKMIENQTTFTTFKDDYNNWIPADKQVNIYYNHIGVGGGGGLGESNQYSSSLGGTESE